MLSSLWNPILFTPAAQLLPVTSHKGSILCLFIGVLVWAKQQTPADISNQIENGQFMSPPCQFYNIGFIFISKWMIKNDKKAWKRPFIYCFIYTSVSFLSFWSPFIKLFLSRLDKLKINYRSKREGRLIDFRRTLLSSTVFINIHHINGRSVSREGM